MNTNIVQMFCAKVAGNISGCVCTDMFQIYFKQVKHVLCACVNVNSRCRYFIHFVNFIDFSASHFKYFLQLASYCYNGQGVKMVLSPSGDLNKSYFILKGHSSWCRFSGVFKSPGGSATVCQGVSNH